MILKFVCPVCGLEDRLTLSQILLSQDLVTECSCRGESECPPFYYADLLDPVNVQEFLAVWERLETQARSQGGDLEIIETNHP